VGEAAVLQQLRARLTPVVSADEKVLPVADTFLSVLPWNGLKRGAILSVDSAVVLFRLLSAASAEGSWVAFVALPELNLGAAKEHGVDLSRIACVASPPPEQVGAVLAALLDAVAITVVSPHVMLSAGDARRLGARARERGGVLIVCDLENATQQQLGFPSRSGGRSGGRSFGGFDIDVQLTSSQRTHRGLEQGYGHLSQWSVEITAAGRRAAARPRRTTLRIGENADDTLPELVHERRPDASSDASGICGAGRFSDVDGLADVLGVETASADTRIPAAITA
jgi:hypothetical protein